MLLWSCLCFLSLCGQLRITITICLHAVPTYDALSNPILKLLTNGNLRQLSPGVTLYCHCLLQFSYYVIFSRMVTVHLHLHCWCARVFLTWDQAGFFLANGERVEKKDAWSQVRALLFKRENEESRFRNLVLFSKPRRASGILGADDPFGDVSKSINLFSVFLLWRFSAFAFAKLFHWSKEDNSSQSQQSCR